MWAAWELLSILVYGELIRRLALIVHLDLFDSIDESNTLDDFPNFVEAADLAPVLLSALTELEDHAQHRIACHIPLRAVGSMSNRREG